MSAVERDHVGEVRALIEEATSHGPYVSALVAQDVVDKLRANDPELLRGWLDAMAVSMLRHVINLRDCSTRTYARTHARRGEFAKDAEAFEAGDRRAMAGWLNIRHVVDEAGTRKRLAEMTAEDLRHVAEDYEAKAREHALHAAFLRALAKKCARRPVGEVFTEAKLNELWLSLSGS